MYLNVKMATQPMSDFFAFFLSSKVSFKFKKEKE